MRTQKLAVATVWMAAACFGAGPKFTVVIFDYAGTTGATLKEAAVTARQAFRAAGVESEWSVCRVSKETDEHCILPPAGTYLEVKVVPSSLGLKTAEAMGLALNPRGERGVVSYAFYEPVKEFAESAGQSVSVVLAYVVAHEIGHLLGMKHGPSGIMKARFDGRGLRDAAVGFLHFTAEDSRVLRAATGK
jgi:predicted metalloprotease